MTETTREILNSLSSLYPLQDYEEQAIDEALKSEPQERKGKWIPSKYGDDTWHTCTSCGCDDKYIDIVERPNGTIGRLESIRNFCPNCGARMEVDAWKSR